VCTDRQVRKFVGQASVEAAVKELLALKTQYKAATGKDWTPGVSATVAAAPAAGATAAAPAAVADKVPPAQHQSAACVTSALNEKIVAQGDAVRVLKAAKADKVLASRLVPSR